MANFSLSGHNILFYMGRDPVPLPIIKWLLWGEESCLSVGNKLAGIPARTSRRDSLTYERNKFGFKHVMEHVSGIPRKCHNFIRKFVALVSLKVPSGYHRANKRNVLVSRKRNMGMGRTYYVEKKVVLIKGGLDEEMKARRGLPLPPLCFYFSLLHLSAGEPIS